MESDLWAELSALLLLTVVLAITSAAHAALPRVNRGRLKHLTGDGDPRAGAVLRLVETSGATVTTLSVANAASIALVACVGLTLDVRYLGASPVPFVLVAAAGLILTLAIQLAAQSAGQLYPDATVFALLWPLRAIDLLLRPLARGLHAATRVVVRADAHQVFDGGLTADEDLRMIVDAAEEDGALEEDEREMIHSIFEMGETTAREVMVPRVDVVAVEASEPLRAVLEIVKKKGFSRIPIYEENIDNIVGIAYAKDLLLHLEAGSLDVPSRVLGRAPHFIPESKKTDELLRDMQREKVHMAVVLDEYGGTAGIITIEDLLEEIVGEIQDEYDTEEISIEKLNDQEAVFDARVNIRDVNETLGVSLEEGGYDTVGGLVYERLGKIPVVGDEVKVDDLKLTVLSTAGKRMKKVRVRVEPEVSEDLSYSR